MLAKYRAKVAEFEAGCNPAMGAHLAPGEELWGWSHGQQTKTFTRGTGYLIGVAPTRLVLLELIDPPAQSPLVRPISPADITKIGFVSGTRQAMADRVGYRVVATLTDGAKYKWDIMHGFGLGRFITASGQQTGIEALHAWCVHHNLESG